MLQNVTYSRSVCFANALATVGMSSVEARSSWVTGKCIDAGSKAAIRSDALVLMPFRTNVDRTCCIMAASDLKLVSASMNAVSLDRTVALVPG